MLPLEQSWVTHRALKRWGSGGWRKSQARVRAKEKAMQPASTQRAIPWLPAVQLEKIRSRLGWLHGSVVLFCRPPLRGVPGTHSRPAGAGEGHGRAQP